MSEQVRCYPTSSIGELFSSYLHPLHVNPYSSHHIYHLAFSPMIVLINVSLSHPFCLPPLPYFSLFHPKCQLSCLRSSIALVLKILKREWIKLTCTWLVVWGRVKIRFQKKTKCETLVD